jgi:lambda family phage portal protein
MANRFASALRRLFRRKPAADSHQRAFAAAKLNRLTASWRLTAETIDDEIRNDLDALRHRSRTLEGDNDFARRYLDLVETNLIGEAAPRLVSLVDNAPGNPDTGARAAIVRAWAEWGKPGTCEVSGQYSWTGLCQAIVRATARDGEALVYRRYGRAAGNRFGYSLQLLDVDRLATWKNQPADSTKNAIVAGVEVDSMGRPLAYHFNTGQRSTANDRATDRIGADAVLHRFVLQRPEQRRGIPWCHAAMLSMYYAGEFALSALLAAKQGADTLGFFVSPDGTPPPIGEEASDEAGARVATSAPGTWETIPVGYDVRSIDSKYPNEVFAPFLKSAYQRMASGLPGSSYPELCNDYEAVNFSSIRAAVLSGRDEWRKRQQWFATAWLEPVFADWLRMSLASGAILLDNGSRLPIEKGEKFVPHLWQFRGWAWVDPLKDMQAAREALDLRITSRTRLASEAGRDIEEIFDEQQTEIALAEKYGIDLKPPPQPAATPFEPKDETP